MEPHRTVLTELSIQGSSSRLSCRSSSRTVSREGTSVTDDDSLGILDLDRGSEGVNLEIYAAVNSDADEGEEDDLKDIYINRLSEDNETPIVTNRTETIVEETEDEEEEDSVERKKGQKKMEETRKSLEKGNTSEEESGFVSSVFVSPFVPKGDTKKEETKKTLEKMNDDDQEEDKSETGASLHSSKTRETDNAEIEEIFRLTSKDSKDADINETVTGDPPFTCACKYSAGLSRQKSEGKPETKISATVSPGNSAVATGKKGGQTDARERAVGQLGVSWGAVSVTGDREDDIHPDPELGRDTRESELSSR